MKLIALGSVHGNLHALEACLRDADASGYDLMVHTGDLAGCGPQPDECIALLRHRNVIGPRGPWDAALAAGDDEAPWVPGGAGAQRLAASCYQWTRRAISAASRRLLASLPFEVGRMEGRFQLGVYHASPIDTRTVLMPGSPEARFREVGDASASSVIVLGGAPMFFHRLAGGRHFINTASVGMPADGGGMTGYAIAQIDTGVAVTFRRLAYDAQGAARVAMERGLPAEWVSASGASVMDMTVGAV